ncbi:sulfide reductase [Alkaliphilus pronyensis]|uniref:Sulfide reductase n=1 Tax=Alkaliphilus pronyensis TaxID=1482732 RepID=A0A6I0FEX1_9FIRM|nr:DsrE/DsrF/DrsH-like family protein [Alkaliphilus pronyensis]KAB3541005.1 sulfide reductase [Alkaliphilus pronyensis]
MSKKVNLLMFSGEFDKALAAFILANTARDMKHDVTMFFTFWGLFLVKDPNKFSDEDKTTYEKLFSMMTPKGIGDLPLSKMNFAGIGKDMLKEMMLDDDTPPLSAFLKGAINKGVKFYGCKLSMEVMGLKKEEMLDQLEVVDAKTYMEDALASDMQLFI